METQTRLSRHNKFISADADSLIKRLTFSCYTNFP